MTDKPKAERLNRIARNLGLAGDEERAREDIEDLELAALEFAIERLAARAMRKLDQSLVHAEADLNALVVEERRGIAALMAAIEDAAEPF